MNGLKPVGRDEVVPLTDEQKKELEKLVEEINATLAEEYGETEYGITVNVEKTPHRKIINEIEKLYDKSLGDKGWKVKFEYPGQMGEGSYFRFTPKWKDD